MYIELHKELTELVSGLKIGCIVYKDITISNSPQMIRGRLQLYQESIAFELDEKPLTQYKGITEWRSIFKQIGMDPSRYRPSHEALLRRIAKRQFVTSVNSAADINNFFSIQYGLPIGIYDFDKIVGNVTIRLGSENENYEGLNNRDIHVHNKLISSDQLGPFGSPFVDSKRTCVTEDTTNALQIIYLDPSMTNENAHELLNAIHHMFTQVNGGTADCFVKQ
ncbi:B3/4 domain-containing protein [Bacillus salitolerans]|uniref:B3/4 domain-containing protein n=1 Tax=Bacillus salitolerans TaxID=1437434 RepID=A0ABW4LZN7_9BACI